MAGCRQGVRMYRNLFLSKGVLEIVFIVTAVCLNGPTSARAQNSAFFLSIDCGGTQGNYSDGTLDWTSDAGSYMNLGKSVDQPSFEQGITDHLGYNQSLLSYRSFPAAGLPETRSKYCYVLQIPDPANTQPGIQYAYLVRVGFYMNSSMLNLTRPFQFMVSVDATNWFTLTSGQADGGNTYVFYVQEGIFYLPNQAMNICLQPVVGEAFISSLELRQLNDTSLYQYPGGSSQYLSQVYRVDLGSYNNAAVRYPDDPYDRIWTAAQWAPLASASGSANSSLTADSYYVPSVVMQNALLSPNSLQAGYYFPAYTDKSLLFITPASYFFIIVYTENLNTSVTQGYNMTVGIEFSADGVPALLPNVLGTPSAWKYPYYVPQRNGFVLTALSSNSTLENVPINALELYGQYSYNASTTNDVDVITNLKALFALTDWQGDPCLPVPHDWLSCTLSDPVFGDLHQPCGFSSTGSGNQCVAPKAALHSTYYVTALNISNSWTSNFTGNYSQYGQLSALQAMSITNSGVDNPTFHYLLNLTSYQLTSLDFSYNKLVGEVSFLELPSNISLQRLNLNHNALTSYPAVRQESVQNLAVLDLSYNQLQGNVSQYDLWVGMNNGSLQEIHMSNNNLTGTFSSDLYFSRLPNLAVMNFGENSIQGVLNLSRWYDALQKANKDLNSSYVTLQLFSFVNNSISDIFPSVEELESSIRNLIKSTNQSFFKSGILLGGNPYCNNPTSYIHQYLCRYTVNDDVQEHHKKHKTEILIASIVGGVGGLLLFSAVFVSLWNLWKQVYTLRAIQQALADRKVQPPFYHYSDLKIATRDFHKDNKLGHGGFGIVYKGVLPDETPLAVKKLFNSKSLQVLDEFLNEVVLITGIKHRNLVQLKGCCIKEKQRLLIFEYVENGNLAEALWGSKGCGTLSWQQRFKICVGVARGLSYLHEELQPSIIHRDIKPENILLDKNFNSKIADFGLARHVEEDASQAYTKVAGTLGYFAPEYVMQGQLSEKVDVYSFGILILNVVSGRKCIDPLRSPEEKFLKDWVSIMCKEDLMFDILQPELRGNCVVEEVIRVIKIGLLCVQHQPELRPTMSQVVTMFLGSMDIKAASEKPSNINSNFSKLLSALDHDAEYPTLKIIDEDSNYFPFLDMNSQSSYSGRGDSSSSQPQSELSTLSGR